MSAQRVGDDPDGFGEVRRAGRVEHDAAGPGQLDRRCQQLALQFHQSGHVTRGAPPAGFRPAPQRTKAGARRIDEHSIEPRVEVWIAAVDPQHLDIETARALFDQIRAVRRGLDSGHAGAGRRAERGQQRGLAARTRAQVQPSAAVVPVEFGEDERAGDKLAALVLDLSLPVAQRVQPAGITAAGKVHRVGGIPPDGAVHRGGELVGRHAARARGQLHRWARVVACQQCVELAGVAAQRVRERLRDPARVGMHESSVPDRVDSGVRRQLGYPRLLVARCDGAQHGVDETGSRRIEFDPGLLDRGRDGRMAVDARAKKLVCTEPQQVEQHGVDLLDWPVGGRRDDRIEKPTGAACPVCELGRECRVPAGDAALVEQRGQREVGVGIAFGYRPQHVERRAAGGVERVASRRGLVGPARRPTSRVGGHDARADSPRRAPRAQSAAAIDLLPGGWT